MIARLKGIIDSVGEDGVVIDVNGVGYLVHCSSRTLSHLVPGEAVALFIETHVRDDAITLYGFLSKSEKSFFRLLVTVQGVGAKVGLAILSIGLPEPLAQAISAQDKAVFTRAAGVGPKLAGRIVAELKDKVWACAGEGTDETIFPQGGAGGTTTLAPSQSSLADGVVDDAVSALVNLGYGRSDAFAAVSRSLAASGDAVTVQTAIGAALKELGKERGVPNDR